MLVVTKKDKKKSERREVIIDPVGRELLRISRFVDTRREAATERVILVRTQKEVCAGAEQVVFKLHMPIFLIPLGFAEEAVSFPA